METPTNLNEIYYKLNANNNIINIQNSEKDKVH